MLPCLNEPDSDEWITSSAHDQSLHKSVNDPLIWARCVGAGKNPKHGEQWVLKTRGFMYKPRISTKNWRRSFSTLMFECAKSDFYVRMCGTHFIAAVRTFLGVLSIGDTWRWCCEVPNIRNHFLRNLYPVTRDSLASVQQLLWFRTLVLRFWIEIRNTHDAELMPYKRQC